MKNFKQYLTFKNVMSWPVITITSLWLVFANLIDTSTNGTSHVAERIIIVLGSLAVFYVALVFVNAILIRRVKQPNRWLALWIVIAILAIGRGFLLAFIWFEVGLSSVLSPWSRTIAGLTNLALLMVLITVAYGMLFETARGRRQLESSRSQLIALRTQFIENRAAQNEELLENVRTRLAESLSPDQLDSPQQTIDSIRSSIDEVIRPLSRTLAQRTSVESTSDSTQNGGFDTKRFFQRFVDVQEIQILPGLFLFALLMLTPLSNVLGPSRAPVIDLLIALQLLVTTWVLKWIALKLLPAISSWFTPVILVASASIGVLIFEPLMPAQIQLSFALGFIIVYLFCTMVPIGLHVAIDESRITAQELENENSELRWALARSNEVTQQQTKKIGAALHGRLQAALAAAAFRLQIAMRDGVNPEEAQQAAKQAAENAIVFDVDANEQSAPLIESINEIAELWTGVCAISLQGGHSVLDQVDMDPVCSRLCSELVIELCTNAIKHGKATNINISLSFESPRIVSVEISNDGVAYDATSSGYGTQLLDQSCVTWFQESFNGLTHVRAHVPWALEEPQNDIL